MAFVLQPAEAAHAGAEAAGSEAAAGAEASKTEADSGSVSLKIKQSLFSIMSFCCTADMRDVGLTKDVCDGLGKHIPATAAPTVVLVRGQR